MTEPNDKRQQALNVARIAWGAMVAGTLMVMLVLGVIVGTGEEAVGDGLGWVFFAVGAVVVAGAIAASEIARKVMRPQVWQGGEFQTEHFTAMQLAGMAPLEGAAVVGLVLAFVDGSIWPTGLVVMVALAALVRRFPSAADVSAPADAAVAPTNETRSV